MKRRAMTLLLAISLTATVGCSSLLEREYAVATHHSTTPELTGTNDALRVDSYQEMVNAILYLVTERAEVGTLRLYDYDQERAAADLTAACTEVSQEDPLGAYSVSFLQYDLSTIVSYLEADISITYRRTQEQVEDIHTVVGTAAIRNAFVRSLSHFDEELVLRLSYFQGGAPELQELLTRAYYETPLSALGMPQVEIAFYPRTGTQRIAEVVLDYGQGVNQGYRQARMTSQARKMIDENDGLKGDLLILSLCQQLMELGGLSETGDTAYDALFSGGATQEGLALGVALLCQQANIHCVVVQGTQNGEPHFWNVVSTDEGYRHLDISTDPQEWTDTLLSTDHQAVEAGYQWNQDWVPLCGDAPLEEMEDNLAIVK